MVSGEKRQLSLKEHTLQTVNLLVGTVICERQQGLKDASAHYNAHRLGLKLFFIPDTMLIRQTQIGVEATL
jgi:hypothetical protein